MTTMNPAQKGTDHRTLTDIKSDAAAVREDLSHLKEDAIDVGSQAAEQAVEKLKCGAESASELAHSAGQQAKAAHASMRKHVAQHPTTAVLVAVGVGAIIGRLMPR